MLAWSLMSGVVGYLACTLLAARAAYGVQRTRIIEREARWHADERDPDPVTRFENNDQSSAATGAFLFGLAWPLTVPGYCLYRGVTFVITANPPTTGPELERRAEAQARRIRALEEALRSPIGEPHHLDGPDGLDGLDGLDRLDQLDGTDRELHQTHTVTGGSHKESGV